MPHRFTILKTLRRLACDSKGNVAMLFGLMAIPLVLAAGVGIDFAQAQSFKNQLQSAVDAAALAGASAYTSSTTGTTAQQIADNYMNKAIAGLPANKGVTFSVSPATTTSGGSTTAYTVAITASATVSNSFMALAGIDTTAITATATAENPVVTGTFNTGGFISYACDWNEIYWYVVPSGTNTVPAASAMNLLWSNDSASPTSSANFSVPASETIGFALKNVTGDRSTSLGGCNYGDNMYGSHVGDTQWFYSSMQPPSAKYNVAPGGASTGTHGVYETTQNCSLFMEQGTTVGGVTTYPAAPQNQCYTSSGAGENEDVFNSSGDLTGICSGCTSSGTTTMATVMTDAATSCGQLNGHPYQYNWNDMGAPVDSYNYGNDMQYSFSCASSSGASTGATGVVLIK